MSTFQDAINKNKKSVDDPKKKNSMPVLKVEDYGEVDKAIDDFLESRKVEKEAKADKEYSADILVDYARKAQDKDGKNNDYHKSYEIEGKSNSVKFISADKFSVNGDDKEKLEKTFKKNFDELFEEKIDVTLKGEVFENDEKQKKLMKLLGDNFNEFFNVTSKLVTKVDFDKNVYGKVNGSNLKEVRTLVKQNKPSIR